MLMPKQRLHTQHRRARVQQQRRTTMPPQT
jgi:hypothetical protein